VCSFDCQAALKQRIVEARSRNHCYCGKAVSIAYSKCMFVALVIHHTIRMHRIILSFVACPALPHFAALSHKRHDCCGKDVEHKMCVVMLCVKFVWNSSHCKKILSCTYWDLHVEFVWNSSHCKKILSCTYWDLHVEFVWNSSHCKKILSCTYWDLHVEFVWNSSHCKKILSCTCWDLHVEFPLFLSDVNENLIFWQIFPKILKY
jgi:hypothetical protein